MKRFLALVFSSKISSWSQQTCLKKIQFFHIFVECILYIFVRAPMSSPSFSCNCPAVCSLIGAPPGIKLKLIYKKKLADGSPSFIHNQEIETTQCFHHQSVHRHVVILDMGESFYVQGFKSPMPYPYKNSHF